MSKRQEGYDKGYEDGSNGEPSLREGPVHFLDFINTEDQTEWEEGYEEGYEAGRQKHEAEE